jgi:hypothetical protein
MYEKAFQMTDRNGVLPIQIAVELFMYEKTFEVTDRNGILPIQMAVESNLSGNVLLDVNRD